MHSYTQSHTLAINVTHARTSQYTFPSASSSRDHSTTITTTDEVVHLCYVRLNYSIPPPLAITHHFVSLFFISHQNRTWSYHHWPLSLSCCTTRYRTSSQFFCPSFFVAARHHHCPAVFYFVKGLLKLRGPGFTHTGTNIHHNSPAYTIKGCKGTMQIHVDHALQFTWCSLQPPLLS